MRVWVTGHNSPGSLPDEEPVEHESFADGIMWLLAKITETRIDRRRYTRATEILSEAQRDEPLVFFFEGQVYWLADFDLHPEES